MLQQIRKMRQEEGGFTLIELLMVIVILGVLAGIVVFAVGGINDRGQASACKADAKTVQVAQEAYYARPGGGTYGSETQLVDGGFLASESKYVNTAVGADGKYTITAVAPCTAAMLA